MTTTSQTDAIDAQLPKPENLPSKRQLLRQTIIAAIGAAIITIVAVLPAEYAIDLTGAGRLLGLQQMGEMKVQFEREGLPNEAPTEAQPTSTPPSTPSLSASATASASAVAAPAPSSSSAPEPKKDVTKVTLAPKKTTEVKARMTAGARLSFKWSAEGGDVNFDLHSDKPGGAYHGYKKGKATRGDQGDLIAAFDGWHGWYWRNVSDAEITITLETSGDYAEVKQMK
jgi:hypothetical protein